MAVAVRNGPVTTTMPLASTTLPEGPGATAGYPVGLGPNAAGGGIGAAVGFGAGNPAALSAGIGANPAAASGDGGIESVMAQDQEMNLYYLQVQEEVNAQNRTFSALSNVMEVEHNTAKTAIGNIH
jgi:hypothetical protein